MRVTSVFGTRPEIIKFAPLLPLIDQEFEHFIVFTGQHFDEEMRDIFFKELEVRLPDYFIDITHTPISSVQIGEMLIKLHQLLSEIRPDLILVLGDTNSTLAGGLAASKLHIPVAHVESGLRCFDKALPEEINRILVDHMSTLLFAPSIRAKQNLCREGIHNGVYNTGNTIVDICKKYAPIARQRGTYKRLGVQREQYVFLTIHREANTRPMVLRRILQALENLKDITFVFPVHPRTQRVLRTLNLSLPNFILLDPLGYIDTLNLIINSRFILTDSGGLQEESITLKVPCLTLRDSTERQETIELHVNKLVGTKPQSIRQMVMEAWEDETWKKRISNVENPYGDGRASQKIVERLRDFEYYLRME